MSTSHHYCVLLIVVAVVVGCGAGAGVPSAHKTALLDLYHATTGVAWFDQQGWGNGQGQGNVCDWFGVECNEEKTSITALRLAGNNLEGTITSSLGQLTDLQELELWDNSLSSTVPDELSSLTALTMLRLNNNQLSGTIGDWVAGPSNIHLLDLSSNQFTGSLPDWSSKSGVRRLLVSENMFSGSFSYHSLFKLKHLEWISVHNNPDLEGSISSNVGQLTSLAYFEAQHTKLSGTIPTELGDCVSLVDVNFAHCNLSGFLPAELENLHQLTLFDVAHNHLTGFIPRFFSSRVPQLAIFLGHNEFWCPLPSFCDDVTGDGSCAPCFDPGPCSEVHEKPGCFDVEMQMCVCGRDESCCKTSWHERCVHLTQGVCVDPLEPRAPSPVMQSNGGVLTTPSPQVVREDEDDDNVVVESAEPATDETQGSTEQQIRDANHHDEHTPHNNKGFLWVLIPSIGVVGLLVVVVVAGGALLTLRKCRQRRSLDIDLAQDDEDPDYD